MATRVDTNPFETTRATDFTDREILSYWVDLVGSDALDRLLKPGSALPMLILGSKGSGKTHLLRYCSYPVRKLQWTGNAVEGVRADGYLGIYVHADGLNTNRFSNKGVDGEIWRSLFQYYFESWFARLLVETVDNVVSGTELMGHEEQIVSQIIDLFDKKPQLESKTFGALGEFFSAQQKQLDFEVNNASFTRSVKGDILFSPGRLMFGIPAIVSEYFKPNVSVQILYLIDELENFSDDQQRFINSLIRYRKGAASLRIGSRLYGVRTYETDGGGEQIKQDAEYEVLPLDSLVRDSKEYARCVRVMCAKRLVEAGFFPSARSARSLAKELDSFFEELPSDEYHKVETQRLVAKYDGRERPYFEKLRKELERFLPSDQRKAQTEAILGHLQMKDLPLLEKLNVLLLYQAWAKGEDLTKAAERIGRAARDFRHDARSARRYGQTLSHYKADLLAQLYRDCRQKPAYAGLPAFIEMSQGVPRNLLGILKHVFSRASFNGEAPFRHGAISISSQRDGVEDASVWLWDDAQPDRYGADVRSAVEALAELLREVRYSDRPAECSLSTFSAMTTQLSLTAQRTILHAVNWSFLTSVPKGHKDKNTKAVAPKFQLNPLLAPRWGVSISRRGTLPLTLTLAEAIFNPEQRGQFRDLLQARVASMYAPFGRGGSMVQGGNEKNGQLSLGVDGT